VSADDRFRCPDCGAASVADDEFCESCGADLRGAHDAAREHAEVDLGVAAGVTDRGHVHRRNEDAMFVQTVGEAAVVVVCDGVSMSVAPEVASEVAAKVVGESLAAALGSDRPLDWDAEAATIRAILAANDAVRDVPWMDTDASLAAPSCTVVAAIWDGTSITVGWAGDSRAYWVGPDGAVRLTVDHSWAREQVDAGLMTPEVAGADRRAHAITRWLGADAPDDVAQVTTYRPTTPGRLVVCSDGLWNYLADDADLMTRGATVDPDVPPIDVARVLTNFALERGGRDNVTVAVVDAVPVLAPLPTGDETR